MLQMALTKGRLEKSTVKMLKSIGYGTEELENKGRQLVFKDSKKRLGILFGQSCRLCYLC